MWKDCKKGFGLDPEPAVDGQDLFYTASIGTGMNCGNVILDCSSQVRFGFDVGSLPIRRFLVRLA